MVSCRYTYVVQDLGIVFLLNLRRARANLAIEIHADFAQNLAVDFVSLLLHVAGVHNHVHLVVHHLLLHLHLLGLLRKFLQNLANLAQVHLLVNAGHDRVCALQSINHVLVDLGAGDPHRNAFQLGNHHIVLVNLLACPDKVFGHDLRWAVLVLLR